jgi:hypothetical protein
MKCNEAFQKLRIYLDRHSAATSHLELPGTASRRYRIRQHHTFICLIFCNQFYERQRSSFERGYGLVTLPEHRQKVEERCK